MIRSYLLSALRQLRKNKQYTALNVFGLSLDLACFALIGLWVFEELTYDHMHTKAERIYRVVGVFKSESDQMQQAVTPTPLAQALVDDLPEIESAVRIDNNDAIVKRDDKQWMEDNILMTDPSFLEIFDFEWLAGNKRTALNEPYSVVLSKSMAQKYFGNENPLNQTLTLFLQDPEGRGRPYMVTGIIEDCPGNVHFQYTMLVSFKTFEVNNPASPEGYDWYNNGYYTYALLREGSSADDVQAKLPALIEKYMGKHNREWNIGYEYFLQPLTDIHLHSHLRYEIKPTNKLSTVIVFGTIGLIVLLLACINYVNLSTAYSARRFKEVGVRKVMGAFRHQLTFQFLVESVLIAWASLALAFGWIELSRPLFEGLTGKPIQWLYTLPTLATLLAIATFVGLTAGFYPAVLLSSFRPALVLKGQWRGVTSGAWLRKSLVVFQYSVTIVLVVGILVVQQQLNFIQTKDLGFNKDQLLMLGVNGSQEVLDGYEGFANALAGMPAIKSIARSNTVLAGGLSNSVATMEDVHGRSYNLTVYRVRVDHNYLNTYEMKLAAGRFFEPGNSADSLHSFVVNEALVREYGYQQPNDVLGKTFEFQGVKGNIIGVVKDFHYSSLQHKVEPTCLRLLRGNFSQIAVRLQGDLPSAVKTVEAQWRKSFPNTLTDFRFAEESVNDQYQAEQRFSNIFLTFSGISLAIACLGLFALISYNIEIRVKEIGIRKVLGASVGSIITMLTREFLLLVAIAAVLAGPVAYYLMNEWLAGFTYRTELNLLLILFAALLVLGIAWLTVSGKSMRAANSNPVQSLRTE